MVKNPETVPLLGQVIPVERQRRLKNRIVRAEEKRDIHVNARLCLIVKVIANMDASVDRSGIPNIHLLAIQATRSHGVENHALAICAEIEWKIFRVVII